MVANLWSNPSFSGESKRVLISCSRILVPGIFKFFFKSHIMRHTFHVAATKTDEK